MTSKVENEAQQRPDSRLQDACELQCRLVFSGYLIFCLFLLSKTIRDRCWGVQAQVGVFRDAFRRRNVRA